MSDDTSLQSPERSIPVPNSLSPQAQAFLAAAAKRIAERENSTAGTLDQSAQAEAALQFMRPMASHFRGAEETVELAGGARLYCMVPDNRKANLQHVALMDIHGGGFTAGGGEMCQLIAKLRASDYGASIYAIDYRLLPNHPYPAALDDCLAAYHEILRRVEAKYLVVSGASAGGNLAAAMLLRARDEGLPLPAALVLQTPALDMTQTGDSYQTNRFLDVNLHGGAVDLPDHYAANADKACPYVSPLFGNFSKGWPPTILTTGTRDLLLSDTVRMHRTLRRAGVRAELHVTEAGPHGGFMGSAPEDREVIAECKRFIHEAWAAG
jgi:monoterpene epsilon-lactone hydrolase